MFFAVLATLLAGLAPAWAERRVALVLGNDRYPKLSSDAQLQNAVSDARVMKATLEALGFDVLSGENLDRVSMLGKLSELKSSLSRGDIAFVFYAGHGVALSGQNYVLPVDVAPATSTGNVGADEIADQAIAESVIDARVQSSGARLVVVVLDACRDDPTAQRVGRAVAASRGLAPPPQTMGILTIHSAGPGQQALDRLGQDDPNPNSVFTRVFSKELLKPGMGLREAAYSTQDQVATLAKRVQQDQFPDIDSRFLGPDPKFGVAPVANADPPAPLMTGGNGVPTNSLSASVTPTPTSSAMQLASLPDSAEIVRQLKSELRRARCEPGEGASWTPQAAAALRRFNAASGSKAGNAPDLASLEVVRNTSDIICPTCEPGTHLDANGNCVRDTLDTTVQHAPVQALPPHHERVPHSAIHHAVISPVIMTHTHAKVIVHVAQRTPSEPPTRSKPSANLHSACYTLNGLHICP